MLSAPTPPAFLSPSRTPPSSLAVPIAGPYLIHSLPMQIMEKRQRSAPRPRSPLRSQICVDEEETRKEVDNKQLEDSDVFAASVDALPISQAQVPSAQTQVNTVTANDRYDPFASYDLECFEDLGLEDVEIGFDIRILDEEREIEEETMMATAGGAVERTDRLSGSAAPVLLPAAPSALPVSATYQASEDSEVSQRPALTRTVDAHVPESDPSVNSTLPLPSSTSAPVGLGLLELAGGANHDVGVFAANADAAAVFCGEVCNGVEAEPIQTMQLMTLESSSSISCLAAPMVPPSIMISVSGPSVSGVSGGPNVSVGSSGVGMMPPSLAATSGASNADRINRANSSTSSLKEPPVQQMCAPTAVMPGPSPTLVRTAPPIPSPEAVEDISVFQPSAIVPAEKLDVAADGVDADVDEAGYIGNRMLKSSAAIDKWRHACADADMDMDVDTESPVASKQCATERESGHPAVERRDDLAHADYRDEPVGRRDTPPLPHVHSVSDAITVTTVTTESSSSSSALKSKKSVDGLGLGLPSEVPGVVVTRTITSLSASAPILCPEEDPMMMMSTAPGCMNLAALARDDVDLEPTSDMASPLMMTSEVHEGTRFFTSVPVYGKRLLWSVEEEDQEDLALFEFDEEEELRKIDESVRKMKERDVDRSSIPILLPRLALGAGVSAGARVLGGAWSRISSLVLSSPAGTSQYDADVEEGAQTGSTSEASSSSHGCLSEEQVPLVAAEIHTAPSDVPVSSASASASALRPALRLGYVSSFMSRISLSRSSSSSASSSSPMAAIFTSPTATGRKSPGFVEHVDAPRGLGLGRLGAAAVKRFQMLF